jgi:hypothetical protein
MGIPEGDMGAPPPAPEAPEAPAASIERKFRAVSFRR